MKLIELELLVAAMRKKANEMGVANPNVEFYDHDRDQLLERHAAGCAFLNMEPVDGVIDQLHEHVVRTDGSVAKRGDFAIPLKLV